VHSAGNAAVVRDEHTLQFNWFWSNAIGGVKIDVPDEDFSDAVDILELQPSEAGVILCPRCGSEDIVVRTLSVVAAFCLFSKSPFRFRF